MEKRNEAQQAMTEMETLKQVNAELSQICLTQGKICEDVIAQINQVQREKNYKIGLMVRRMIAQCIRGHEKKDFFRWCYQKALKKPLTARELKEFDPLEGVKSSVWQCIIEASDYLVDDEKVAYKRKGNVFIFAAVPFFDVGGGQRSSQLARTFNAMGKNVHYIHGFPCSEADAPEMFIPASTHRYIDEITLTWFKKRLTKDDLVIFEIPYIKFEPYLKLAKEVGAYTVYEHIDNWDTSLGCLFYDKDVFERYLATVDLVTVTAKMLGEKIREVSGRDYVYLANAVNTEIFEPSKTYDCPNDLVRGKEKTLLYFGSLWGEWFDWEKIDYIAEACPDCEINLIGDYSGCMERVKRAKKNVHFLGIKKQTDLPAYLQHTDVALLPFKNCDIGKYVSPLKIFEYIAMNVRVLSTPLDDIQNYPNVVCSDTNEGWVQALRADAPLVDSSTFISANNWYTRCGAMLERAGLLRKSYPSISVIVLNRNNMKVIRRCVQTLLAHRAPYDYEIIVVDNDSTDGSREMLEREYGEQIVLVKNDKNGCSCGRNLGARHAKGEVLCFLDSDQWVICDRWMDAPLSVLETEPAIGATGWAGGWFNPDGTAGVTADDLLNRGMYLPSIRYRKDLAYLGSGGMLMRRALFEQIGGFDEAYDPTCFEDTDISMAVRYAGYELAYCPYMGVMHLPHQTTNSGSAAHTALMKKNGAYMVEKWTKRRPELLKYYYQE